MSGQFNRPSVWPYTYYTLSYIHPSLQGHCLLPAYASFCTPHLQLCQSLLACSDFIPNLLKCRALIGTQLYLISELPWEHDGSIPRSWWILLGFYCSPLCGVFVSANVNACIWGSAPFTSSDIWHIWLAKFEPQNADMNMHEPSLGCNSHPSLNHLSYEPRLQIINWT